MPFIYNCINSLWKKNSKKLSKYEILIDQNVNKIWINIRGNKKKFNLNLLIQFVCGYCCVFFLL